MTEAAQDPARADLIEHPAWCGQAGCGRDPSGDILHREMPSGAIVSSDRQHMTFGLIQCDEVAADGRQVTHPAEGMVTLGEAAAVFDVDGLKAIRDAAAALVEQLRQPVSSEAT